MTDLERLRAFKRGGPGRAWSYRELARMLGTAPRNVRRMLSGQQGIPLKILRRLDGDHGEGVAQTPEGHSQGRNDS